MARRNTRRRNRPTISSRGSSNRRSVARAVSRIEQRAPYRVGCSADPPSIRLGLNITKYVVIMVQTTTAAKGIDYGSPTKPGSIYITSAVPPLQVSITRYDLMRYIGAQTLGLDEAGCLAYLDMMCMRKVCAWGPNNQVHIDSISLVLLTPDANATTKILPYPSPLVTDSGTPARRAKVSMTVPSPPWFAPDNDAVSKEDNMLGFIVGSGSDVKIAAGQAVGTLHVLISFVAGEVKP